MAKKKKKQRGLLDRADDINNDQQTVDRIKRLSQQTGYHPTYIAAWVDVERGKTPEEKANRAAQMSRGKGDAFTQYSDNTQRQYETGQQMKNSKKNRRHQTELQEDSQDHDHWKQTATVDENKRKETVQIGENKRQEKEKKKSDKRSSKRATKENRRQEDVREDAATLDHDRRLEAGEITHGHRMEEIGAGSGNKTNAEISAQEHDAVLAEPPSFRRYNQLRQGAVSMLGKGATEEDIQNFIQQDMADTYFNFFHDPESPIAASGHVPPGLGAEMKEVIGEMSFEDFADYVGLDTNDGRTGEWYTEITGKAPNHDHWLW